ncbi:M48 family metallopeptidase [Solibacillus silvestris]|uniref:M48 family metallopeptidase n=1 Tax=Solibacillus silvestris TaxID=76853 RepID=UPI003F805BB3
MKKDLVYRKEKLYFAILLIVSILIYVAMFISIIGIVILAVLFLFYSFIHNLSMVNIRKNGIKISEQQFPAFYAKAGAVAEQMNLAKMPDIYVMQSGGILNAFATKFGMKNMVVLYSDVFALIEEQGEGEVLYILAHEFAHIKRKHVGYGWLLMPGLAFPFLGSAYSRACEFTCDRYGAYYSQSYESAKNALAVLAIGPQLYKQVDQSVYSQQIATESGVFSWIDEIMSTHPNLPKRIHELNRFFDAENTPQIKSSKRGVVLGIGVLILAMGLFVFGSIWVMKKIENIALLGDDLLYDDFTYEDSSESMNELMLSVVNYDLDAVKEYAADETMLNEKNEDGYTALHLAVIENNYDAAQYLLEHGANPDTMDMYEYTPLMEAVGYENYEMVELLLNAGTDKAIKDSDGYDAYQLALEYGFLELAEYIQNF